MKTVLWQQSLTQIRQTLETSADGTLLERFITQGDTDAFASLLQRHGPMVFGVCQRVLANHADAEDAFQATFVVLVRKARTIRDRATLANWLYGVAHTTALKARAMRTKRTTKEAQTVRVEPTSDPTTDWLPLLDEEISRLPTIYRTALVLCDLEGKSHKEAGERLGCATGTISARIARGRRLLAERLTRRGLILTVGVLAATLRGPTAQALVTPTLIQATIDAARGPLVGTVAALTDKVIKTMYLKKIKVAASCFLVAALTLMGFTPGHVPNAEAQTKEVIDKIELDVNLLRLEGGWYPDQLVTTHGVKPYPLKGRAVYFQKGAFFRFEGNQVVSSGKYKIEGDYLTLMTDERHPWDLETGAVKDSLQYTFKVDGDILTLCYDLKKRPKAGDLTPGDGRQVTVFKREKGTTMLEGAGRRALLGTPKGLVPLEGQGIGGGVDALLLGDPLGAPPKPGVAKPTDSSPLPKVSGGGPTIPTTSAESQRLERLERELSELRKLLEDRLPKPERK